MPRLETERRLHVAHFVIGDDAQIILPAQISARARAAQHHANATFIQSDAQSYAFAPATFDRIVSRFGVMFFTDSMQAFANLRQAATPGARMDLIAWRAPQENAFMTTAERAAATLLPNIPPRFSIAGHLIRDTLAAMQAGSLG